MLSAVVEGRRPGCKGTLASASVLGAVICAKIGCSTKRSLRTFMMVWVRVATKSEPSFLFATRYSYVLRVVRSSSGTGGDPRNVPLGHVEAIIGPFCFRYCSGRFDRNQYRDVLEFCGKNPRTSDRYFSLKGITTRIPRFCLHLPQLTIRRALPVVTVPLR